MGENQSQYLPLSRSLYRQAGLITTACVEIVLRSLDSDPQKAAGLQVKQDLVIMVGNHLSDHVPVRRLDQGVNYMAPTLPSLLWEWVNAKHRDGVPNCIWLACSPTAGQWTRLRGRSISTLASFEKRA